MKRALILPALLFLIGLAAFAQEESPSGVFIGVGPEIKSNTRSGAAPGGSLLFGLDINSLFAAGQKTSFFHDMDTVSSLELQGFFRFYLPVLHWPTNLSGPFLQAEAGGVFFFEEDEAFPAFSGGVSAGWRFLFQQKSGAGYNWYVEPVVRAGYPYIWGAGVTVGIRFKRHVTVNAQEKEVVVIREEIIVERERAAESNEQKEKTVEEAKPEPVKAPIAAPVKEEKPDMSDEEKSRVRNSFIYFSPNSVGFIGLSEEILTNNADTFEFIAQILNKYGDYKIMAEGHANPTTEEGPGRVSEEGELKRLSEERALMVITGLARRGVAFDRMLYSGFGSSRPVVSFEDNKNTWKNRRVGFVLIKDEK